MIPTFGSIKTFNDVKQALDRIRAYFQELAKSAAASPVPSAGTATGGNVIAGGTITEDSNLVEYQGATGRIIKDGGIRHAEVVRAIGSVEGDMIRYNATMGAWEVKHEPLVFNQIILTPALAAILDAEGGMWYKSTDKSIYVCTAVA